MGRVVASLTWVLSSRNYRVVKASFFDLLESDFILLSPFVLPGSVLNKDSPIDVLLTGLAFAGEDVVIDAIA